MAFKILLAILVVAAMLGALIWAVRQKRHVLGVIVALAALAVGIPLLWALYYLSTFDTLQGFVSNITDAFGLPSSLANAGAALLLVPAVMVFGMVVSLSGERRTMGLSLLTIGIAAYWVLIWAGTRDHLIATDGSQLRCYTISQDGVRFFETQQIDPRTGEMCQWVDRENLRYVQAIDRRLRSGEPIRPLQFRSRDEVRFFATGTSGPIPLVWYHQAPDGNYEFFDVPGVHPVLGTQLRPITQQVAEDWLGQVDLPEGRIATTSDAVGSARDLESQREVLDLPEEIWAEAFEQSIVVNECSNGYSYVPTPAGTSIEWDWPIRAQYLRGSNQWIDLAPHAYADTPLTRFCAHMSSPFVGRSMPLRWSR
jgi:hypothetical protein